VATSRERLHDILEALPEERLNEAEAALEPLLDPVLLAFLNAPQDDEATTAEDLDAIAEARNEHERGETLSLDEAMAELARRPS
jgi:hypothetical protein